MKTEDVITYAVLGFTIYAVLNAAFAKKPAAGTPQTSTTPIPIPGGINPVTLNTGGGGFMPDPDFGLIDPSTWG